jgi:hypothetical protein
MEVVKNEIGAGDENGSRPQANSGHYTGLAQRENYLQAAPATMWTFTH